MRKVPIASTPLAELHARNGTTLRCDAAVTGFDGTERVVEWLEGEHGLEVADLPLHHRDPFDRLLIAQARREGLTIVTADRRFAAYEVPLVEVP